MKSLLTASDWTQPCAAELLEFSRGVFPIDIEMLIRSNSNMLRKQIFKEIDCRVIKLFEFIEFVAAKLATRNLSYPSL